MPLSGSRIWAGCGSQFLNKLLCQAPQPCKVGDNAARVDPLPRLVQLPDNVIGCTALATRKYVAEYAPPICSDGSAARIHVHMEQGARSPGDRGSRYPAGAVACGPTGPATAAVHIGERAELSRRGRRGGGAGSTQAKAQPTLDIGCQAGLELDGALCLSCPPPLPVRRSPSSLLCARRRARRAGPRRSSSLPARPGARLQDVPRMALHRRWVGGPPVPDAVAKSR